MIKISLITLFTLVITISFGQNKPNRYFDEVSIGLIKGQTKFYKYGKPQALTNNKYGFGLDIYRVWRKQKNINLILGFEYNLIRYQTIFEQETQFGSDYTDYNVIRHNYNKANTLSIPILLRITFLKSKKIFIEGGPIVDFLNLSTKSTLSEYTIIDLSDINSENPQNFISNYNSIKLVSTFGFKGGIGFDLPFTKHKLFTKVTYQYRFGYAGTSFCCQTINLNTFKFSIGLNL